MQHKLTLLRKKETSTTSFRRLLNEIGSLMAYDVTREMPMHEIETPMETMQSRLIDGKKLVFVPILRAGTGLLDGFLSVRTRESQTLPRSTCARNAECRRSPSLPSLQARDPVEAIRLRATRLKVFRAGRVIAETPATTAALHLDGRPKTVDWSVRSRGAGDRSN